MVTQRELVGRDSERQRVLAVVTSAREETPAALLLHGEAGIGKTSLAKELLEAPESQDCHLLYGSCLRFGAEGAAFLPLTAALTGWLRQADTVERTRLLRGARRGEDLISASDPGRSSGDAVLQWSRAIDALVDDGPTVLVVDDLQWADQSTLDAISYVLTGFRPGLRIAMVGTYRDTDLDDGHRLLAWLADVSRLPGVDSLALDRLDPWATEELVSTISPTRRSARVAEAVYLRSRGNPYLAELLARSHDAGDLTPAPEAGAVGLRDAVLGSWHRLGPVARQVSQLLAVGGRPVTHRVLKDLAARRDIAASDFAGALGEASRHGVAHLRETGDVWFFHPLLAEVIAGTVPPWEAAELHLAYADLWTNAEEVTERDRTHRLALHYEAAGRFDDAYAWSLQAAEEAVQVGANGAVANHLTRAVSLVPRLSPTAAVGVDGIDLQRRAAEACERAGHYDDALRLYERALADVDRSARPLDAVRMLLPLPFLRDFLGHGWGESPDEWLESIALCEGLDPSPEESMAWAYLAFSEVFTADPGARGHAEHAVEMARMVRSREALAWATAVLSQTMWGTARGLRLSLDALEVARGVHDSALLARTAVMVTNSYQSLGRYSEAADVALEVYAAILGLGQRHDAANIGAIGAQFLVSLGRLQEAETLVREILSFRQGRRWSGETRCSAAMLSARQGRVQAAQRHLERAHELVPNHQAVGDVVDLAEMQVMVDLGHPERALDIADTVMAEATRIDPTTADDYLLLAAQAAADLVEAASLPAPREVARLRLARLEELRDASEAPRFQARGPEDLVHPAHGAIFLADRARCHGDPDEGRRWEAALAAAQAAGLRYEQARAGLHLARRLLSSTRQRGHAQHELRTAASMASELGARPLQERMVELANQAHLDLRRPPAAPAESVPTLVAGAALTGREREVLSHLVEGETYAQIATALFISEKTVSVHVSNLLRKAGVASRIELAEATRRAEAAGGAL